MLYATLQNNANKNSPAFYNIIKKPSQSGLANELTTIAKAKQTILYLSPTLVAQVMKKLGFTQKININEKWHLTLPKGNIQLEFINNTVARISVDAQTLLDNSSLATQPKALTLPNPPAVVFSLPVPNTKALTIEKNSILAVQPAQLETLLIDFFFNLLQKGQKIEQQTKGQQINRPFNQKPAQQKISPAMRKILDLPEDKTFFPSKTYPEIKSSSLLPEWIQQNTQNKKEFNSSQKIGNFKPPVIKRRLLPTKLPIFNLPKK